LHYVSDVVSRPTGSVTCGCLHSTRLLLVLTYKAIFRVQCVIRRRKLGELGMDFGRVKLCYLLVDLTTVRMG
jgi:hypothetical protein